MIYVKKLMATCAALALAATSMLPMTAFAADDEISFSIETDKASYEVGETVTATVKIDKNTGSNSWSVLIGYTDGLTCTYLEPVEQKQGTRNKSTTPQAGLEENNPTKFSWTQAETVYKDVYKTLPDGISDGNIAYNWTFTGDVGYIEFTATKAGTQTLTLSAGGQAFKTTGTKTEPGAYQYFDETIGSPVSFEVKSKAGETTLTAADKLEVAEGDSANITYSVDPTDTAVTFESADTSIATVDNTGKVTGVKAGKTNVTVKAGDKTATVEVTVTAKDVTLTVPATLEVEESKTADLTYTVTPASTVVTFESKNTDIATVDANGKVTGVKEGTATIVTKAGDKSAETVVTVKPFVPVDVTGVTIDKSAASDGALTVTPGTTFKLPVVVSPADATDKTVTYTSSNPVVAAVDKDGNVTAYIPGETEITVATPDGKFSDKITVKVEKFKKSVPVAVGDKVSVDYTALGLPEAVVKSVLDSTVTVSIDNPNSDVATTDFTDKGFDIKGLKAGTTDLTISIILPTGGDPIVLGTVNVTVYEKGDSDFTVKFKKDPTIKVGEKAQLELVVDPADYEFASDFSDITGWNLSVDDDSILKIVEKTDADGNVYATGAVTGLKSGTAIVTATNPDYVDKDGHMIPVKCTVTVKPVLPACDNGTGLLIDPQDGNPDPNGVTRAKVSPYVAALPDSSSTSSAGPIAATGGVVDSDDTTSNAPAIAAAALGVIALGFVVVARKKRHS